MIPEFMKINYHFILTLAVFSLAASASFAQSDKDTRPSPPVEVKGIVNGVNITINYSSPSVKGRTVWGDLVPYDKVWRTGANEATTFETDGELTIQGKKLPAGKYALFTIPGESEWTWIFNSVWEQWGAYKYDEAQDVLRIKSGTEKSSVFNERFVFFITEDGVSIAWENLVVKLKV